MRIEGNDIDFTMAPNSDITIKNAVTFPSQETYGNLLANSSCLDVWSETLEHEEYIYKYFI